MKKFFVNEKCVGCYSCVNDCPVRAIKISQSSPKINKKICIGCGDCFEICPVGAIEFYDESIEKKIIFISEQGSE